MIVRKIEYIFSHQYLN